MKTHKKSQLRKIVDWRYEGLTFEEIGSKVGVTRQRAHQLFKKALGFYPELPPPPRSHGRKPNVKEMLLRVKDFDTHMRSGSQWWEAGEAMGITRVTARKYAKLSENYRRKPKSQSSA